MIEIVRSFGLLPVVIAQKAEAKFAKFAHDRAKRQKEDFEKNIRQQFLYLMKSDNAEYQKKNQNKTELFMYMNNDPKWHYEGQDLCNFSEDGPSQFVTIRSHPTKIYKLKIMLKNVDYVYVK